MRWLPKLLSRTKRRNGAQTSATLSDPHFFAKIDEADRDGQIWGWAAIRDPQIQAIAVEIRFDGQRGIPCESKLFREDLLKAGFGDGCHAFVANLPRALVAAADSVALVGHTSQGEEILTVRSLAGVDRRTRPLVVFLDFSDLIVYLTKHRNLSGIQRTQCSFVLHLLQKHHPDFEYKLCCRDHFDLKFREVDEKSFGALLTAAFGVGMMNEEQWAAYIKMFWAATASPIACRDGDIVLTLGAPWAVAGHQLALSAIKRRKSIRYFQLLYDLIPLTAPEYVDPPLIPIFADAIAGMLMNAEHVFSISEFTSKELVSFVQKHGVQCPPVSVIKMGGTIDDTIGHQSALRVETSIGGFRPQDQEFVLCVGTLEPRKNHQLVVNVWRKLIATRGIQSVPKLVLIGRVGWSVETLERQLLMTDHLDGAIVHLTKVSDADLRIIIEHCMFTVFPSFYEGWGLPIVESLTAGKVCVSSNATSMQEAGGDSVIYIDPLDFVGAFETIEGLIYDRELLRRKTSDLKNNYVPISWMEAADYFDATIRKAIELSDPSSKRGVPQAISLKTGRIHDFSTLGLSLTGDMAFAAADRRLRLLAVLADGEWYDPDDWGCWSCSPEPRLQFVVDDRSECNLVVYLKLRLWAAKLSATVEVSVDGTPQGRLSFDEKGHSHCLIRIPAQEQGHMYTVDFKIDHGHPVWRGVFAGSEDHKVVGLGLSSMYICPDLAEDRLRYLEAPLAFPF